MVKVKDIMASNVVTILKNTKIKDSADLMKRNGVGSLLVKEDEEIVGIVTGTDIVQKVVSQGLSPQITRAESVMSYPVMTVEAGAEIQEAADMMEQNGVRHLPVTDNGKIIGMISARDLFRLYCEGGERPAS